MMSTPRDTKFDEGLAAKDRRDDNFSEGRRPGNDSNETNNTRTDHDDDERSLDGGLSGRFPHARA